MAHVGVMEVLDSAGIRPDLIVGTSIGAILGALYASGYSGHEIDSLVRTLHLADLVGARPVEIPLARDQLYPLLRWQTGSRGLQLQPLASNDAYLDGLLNGLLL
ncbi:MAG TPA: patatin-like phospholipase family protein, partial [Vicinamibacterales bacterium]